MPQAEPLLELNGQGQEAQFPNPEEGPGASTTRTEESDAAIAIRLADERQVEVFCDELRSPCIRLPDDPVEPIWPLHHQRVRSWIAELVHGKTRRFIAEKDIAAVLRVLEGRAWKAPRRAPTTDPTWQRIERDPVALALMIYANTHGEFEGMTRDLFGKLFEPTIQDRLRMASLAHKFPLNTQVFSRRLGDAKAVLHQIGLDINVERKEAGSYCTLKIRQPDFLREPDGIRVIPTAKASGTSTGMQATWLPADGTDAPPKENIEAVLAELRTIREELP
ncbi:MAG: hypothetical protein ACK4RK_16490 [Gemmataceae bacterium]